MIRLRLYQGATRWVFAVLLSLSMFAVAADAVTSGLLYVPDVAVKGFRPVVEADGAVRLRWTTEWEFGAGTFLIRRRRLDGVAQRRDVGAVRLREAEEGWSYTCPDPGIFEGCDACYELVFVSREDERVVAEWDGVVASAAALSRSPARPSASITAGADPMPRPWIGSEPRVRVWAGGKPADRVRVSLRQSGLYRLTARELAAAGGWDVVDVEAALSATNLAMSCQGAAVAWLADDDALLFYGIPAQSRYAPENVYWVTFGRGVSISNRVSAPPANGVTNAWFSHSLTFQGTNYLSRVSHSTLADAPAPYVAFRLIGSGEEFSHPVKLPDCAPGVWEGAVTVNLLSYYAGADYENRARISLGGATLGAATWLGEQYVSFAFPFSSTNLNAGSANLRIENTYPEPSSSQSDHHRFLEVSCEVEYQRRYRALNGALRCAGGEGDVVVVAGFATNNVVALEVTDPYAPLAVESVGATRDAVEGTWTAAFACGGTGRIYQVCSRSDGLLQPAVRGVRDTDWARPGAVPQHAILIPPQAWRDDFRAVMRPLADYRNALGMHTKIIDVEQLYNDFSDGLVDPRAIRSFCEVAHPRGLSYLLLAGSGSLDYKHQRFSVNDSPACLIPTLIAGQRFSTGEGMTVAMDAALGDADGDGLPDVAVGRLPSSHSDDLAVVVGKTIDYEKNSRWRRQFDLAADWDNVGVMKYPFAAGTDRLLAPLSAAGREVSRHYLADAEDAIRVRDESLFPSLRMGSALFHFFGHSNEISLSDGHNGRLLRKYDIKSTNWQNPAVAVFMGCRVNRWQGLTATVAIMAAGLFAANTGFVGGLGPTGNMMAGEGEEFALAIYTDTDANQGVLRLGDMQLRGVRSLRGSILDERLLSISLIGDPALRVSAVPGSVILLQ